MSVFEKRQGVVAISDPTVAAALMCKGIHWGNSDGERRDFMKGITPEFKPFYYQGRETYKHAKTGNVRVLFLIGGDVDQMTIRRRLFYSGQLYVNGKEWRHHREFLMSEINAAKQKMESLAPTLPPNP